MTNFHADRSELEVEEMIVAAIVKRIAKIRQKYAAPHTTQNHMWRNDLVFRVPLKIHFYEIVNNTSQYDVSVFKLCLNTETYPLLRSSSLKDGQYRQYWPLLVPALARFLTI
jgi:hypothetical protein